MTEDDFLDRISSYSEELHQKLCRFAHTPGVLNHQVQLKSYVMFALFNYVIKVIYGHHNIHVCHCHIMCQAKVTCHIKLNKS